MSSADAAVWVDWLGTLPLWLLLLALFGGALIEYVFPPFPGDFVVVVGAVAAGVGERPLVPVFVAVTLGAVLGTAVDWWVGTRAAGSLHKLSPKRRRTVERLVRGFRRVGPVLLVLNRFAPGIRALFFVAAGVAGLGLGPVVAWSTLSATVWNVLLIGIGLQVGWHVDKVLAWLEPLGWVGPVVLVVLVGVWAVATLRSDDPEPS